MRDKNSHDDRHRNQRTTAGSSLPKGVPAQLLRDRQRDLEARQEVRRWR